MSTAAADITRKVDEKPRIHPIVRLALGLRAFGHFIVALALASALVDHQAPLARWALLPVTTFLWPVLAYLYACRASNHKGAEYRNMCVDSFIHGVWGALIGYNPWVIIGVIGALAVAQLSTAGFRVVRACLMAAIAGLIVGGLLTGFEVILTVSLRTQILAAVATGLFTLLFGVQTNRQSLAAYRVRRELAARNLFIEQQSEALDLARQAALVARAEAEAIAVKISLYLSPQVYKSIFMGSMDVKIQTQRKKLTIFFSDIKDFTELTEKLQPEEITALINEYFSEMSIITHKHGGTIDKFVGDAILVFFGDPTSCGVVEDAQACVRMAIEMQTRIAELNVAWRKNGAEDIFRVRMGINTGYCNVGNFGSNERMDYTILGAEANLAARLQSIAGAGSIIMSYETYALVSPIVSARRLPSTSMKGLSREVVPYQVDGLLGDDGVPVTIFNEHTAGLDLYLNMERIDSDAAEHLREIFNNVITALDKKHNLL